MAPNLPLTDAPLRDAVTTLLALTEIDTLYRDLYLQRTRELLQHEMSPESYRGMLRMRGELENFPNRLRNALLQQDWQGVKQMSAEMESLKHSFERYGELFRLAKGVYEQEEIPIDPFSPGMATLAGKSYKELPELREKGLSLLSAVATTDTGWRDFYIRRLDSFGVETAQPAPELGNGATLGSSDRLQQQAQEALDKGNLNMLYEVADALSKGAEASAAAAAGDAPSGHEEGEPLKYSFPEPVLERARSLGLAPFTVESRFQAYLRFAPYLWHPTFAEVENEQGRALRLSSLKLPAQAPEAVRSMLEMFMLHPFINSAGIRSVTTLVEEDALVEDFAEPADGEWESAPGALIEALGLHRRNALTRLEIEAALRDGGNGIVKERLGLDPAQFCLVCIPCDLHLRIGQKQGWGRRELWTHFDGYMLTADAKMHALAGGDVRFGGLFDLVAISRNYGPDRIMVRFAVVQRRRMARVR